MVAAINGKRRSEPARLPSPSSLRSYLSMHSSSCASLCTRSTPTHAIEPNSPAPPPQVPAAAVQASPSVKDHLRRLPSLLFGFTRGSSSSIGCRFPSSEPVVPRLVHAGASPVLPPLPSPATVESSSSSSSLASPLNSEHLSPPVFPSFHAQQRTRELTGVAAPPPSGAGRR
jgi:hypothetical protein